MEKENLLFLILFMFFFTGCQATYKINIYSNNVSENLKLIETDTLKFDIENDSGWTLRDSFESLLENDEFSKEEYKIKSLNKKNQLGIEYKNKYPLDEISESSIINQCYSNISITEDEKNIYINTGNNFNCFEYYEYLDFINIELKTNHEVIESNATTISNGVYKWEFNEQSDKEIKLTLSKTNIKSSNYVLYLVFLVVIIVSIVGYLFYNKNKSRNKI
jgi:hypothetical protein